ncbi:HIT family protein [Rhodococcus sp. BP-349]|uniref:HIT family protein n=1 Tax=unclassified Rhodococcus (in: high G+C Gram-positive bacteria) TaxID=192944 RepID=UPI001C9B0C8A|nr:MULTISPECIES: HIT family protein [unclassified Rhodococcus (in: high G+C Gram-positive bacteria)]MBY6540190.1 HIT family protein [Rhodococcus sp. BP-363]MBY6543482.1 HIT family protein [Rhodococcus sp. BP-369]MBY6562712.1 HIT family protein [Rhodococcus sp. BP-370]MBY6577004.1 HIT family protein [Rhodococcus sp. BP-364]MBY6586305.1 HIT family protein [Rhodococcus sp. BP-358]
MTECVFCDIVARRAPATIVHETDSVLAFLDIRPVTRGHTLVVPKVHSSGLETLDPAVGGQVFAAGQALAGAMRRSTLAADGVNLAMNDGRAAFQTMFHSHLHVVPRHHGDRIRFVAGMITRRQSEPEATARAIRAALAS